MEFLNYGYYIVEPAYVRDKKVLTIGCLCETQPNLVGCFYTESSGAFGKRTHEEDQIKYQKELNLTDDEFQALKDFLKNRIYMSAPGERFAELADALHIVEKFLYTVPNLKIVSVKIEGINPAIKSFGVQKEVLR